MYLRAVRNKLSPISLVQKHKQHSRVYQFLTTVAQHAFRCEAGEGMPPLGDEGQ